MPEDPVPRQPRKHDFLSERALDFSVPEKYSNLRFFKANVAQLVEQIIRNDQVVRSIRIVGSI